MKNYIKSRLIDLVLCVIMSAGLTSVVCSGFDMYNPNSDSAAAIFMLTAVVSAIVLMFSYRRVTVLCGICTGIFIAAGSVFYMHAIHPLEDEGAHSEFIFILIGITVSLLVFLLSRTRLGTVALFIAGNIACAGAHFLDFSTNTWSFIVFLIAVMAMFFYRVYMISLFEADMGNAAMAQYMRQTVVVCLIVLILASGLFAGVVRPLDPPTQDLKLIRILKQMEMLEVLGIYDIKNVLNPFLDSADVPDQTEFSQNKGEDESEAIDQSQEQSESENNESNPAFQVKADAIRYLFAESHLMLLVIPLIILLTAAVYVLVLQRRKKWRRILQSLSREDAVLNYYNYFLRDLSIVGIQKPFQHTLREFTENSDHELEAFDAGGITFNEISFIYEKVFYGKMKISEQEYELYEKYFDEFHKNIKNKIGKIKYYLNWIRL